MTKRQTPNDVQLEHESTNKVISDVAKLLTKVESFFELLGNTSFASTVRIHRNMLTELIKPVNISKG